jgi:hypothetical protein
MTIGAIAALAAATLLVVGPVGARAAPPVKDPVLTVSLRVGHDCTATVTVRWRNVPAEDTNVYDNLYVSGSFWRYEVTTAATTHDSFRWTFDGYPSATSLSVQGGADVYVGGVWYMSQTSDPVDAYCTWGPRQDG